MDEFWTIRAVGFGNDGEEIVNSFNYWWDNTGSAAVSPIDVVNAAAAILYDPLIAALTHDYTFDHFESACLSGPNAHLFAINLTHNGTAGSRTGNSAPYCTCAVIKRESIFAKRWGRGRIFVSPILETDVTPDGFIQDGITLFNALGAALLETLAVIEVEMLPVTSVKTWGGVVALALDTAISAVVGIRRSRRARATGD